MAEYIEFQEGKKYPSKNADRAKNADAFKDAGYILNDEELVIDVDNLDRPTIEKLIHHFGIKTQIVWTDTGAHFYYRKPQGFKGNKIVCPLGFEIEYKHSKNTPNGVTIKRNGKMREIDNAGIREDLPDFFSYKRGLKNLYGMEESEGRNRDLFAHRMRIANLGSWKSILRFINNNIFATPLDEKEFQTVARDGVKPKAEKHNQPDIAKYLIDTYKVVSYLGKMYWFVDGTYICDDEKIDRLIAIEVPSQKTNFYNEVKKQMEFQAPLIDKAATFDIKLQNGILRNGKFYAIDFVEFTPYSINIPYFKDATPVPTVDEYLDFVCEGDPDFKARLLESLAHCFITNREFKSMLGKLFIFVGGGGNGKGTLLKIITKILGEENVSSLSIKQMADERYFASMFGKLANLGDDIEDEFISKEQVKMLKNISTCDRVQMRRMFENSKDVQLTCSLIFTSNHVLKAREKGDSWKRRVDWIPLYAKPKRKDAKLFAKLTKPESLQYWIRLIVEAYQRLHKNECFTFCDRINQFNEEYHKMNNNINEFLFDYDPQDFIGKQKRESFREYRAWCEENEEQPLGAEKFHEELSNRFNLDLKRYDEKKSNGSSKRTTVWRYASANCVKAE
jgi:putative DNA primase/helicase